MRHYLFLLAISLLLALTLRAQAPATHEPAIVRPVAWWSDTPRTSDGGGGMLAQTTVCIADAKGFANEWARQGLKGSPPWVDFKSYVVVAAFRVSGVDFNLSGGLLVQPDGSATVVGTPAFHIVTNAGWYSTTLAVFPRVGVVSINGQPLPAAK